MYLDDIFESGSEDKIASIKRKLRLMVDNDVNLVKLLLKNNNYELNYIELAKPEELVDMLFDVIKSNNNIMENLRQWFKEKWVRFGPDGKIRGDCARGDDSEGKPKCLPQSKAHSLGKKGRASAASRKRREDPNPERSGPAINVATKKKSVNEFAPTPDRGDDSGQPRWLVTYDIYGTNRDKPLYTSSKKIYANSAKEAIELCKKFFGGRNFRAIQINEELNVAEEAQPQFVAARYIDEFADGEYWYVKGTPQVIQRFVQLANSLEDESVKGTEYEPGKGMMANIHSKLGNDNIPQWQIVQAQNLEAIKPIGSRVLQLLMQPDLTYGVQEFMSEFLWTLEEKGLALVTTEPEQGVAEGAMKDLHIDLQDQQWDSIVGYVINGLKKNMDIGRIELNLYKYAGQEMFDVDQELQDRGFKDIADLADHIRQHNGRYVPPTDFGLTDLGKGVAEDSENNLNPDNIAALLRSQSSYGDGQDGDILMHATTHLVRNLKYDRQKAVNLIYKTPLGDQIVQAYHELRRQGVAEEQLDELKCWPGYTRVRGVPAGAPGSCKKKTNEDKSKHIDSDTVRRIQELLNKKFNANLDVDGILGPLTIKSLKKFLPKTAKKAAPNPERNTAVQGLELKEEKCPECNGPLFNEMLLHEKKDACYYKVKSSYKVWPSAYASGALVKCRNKGAKNWGNKSESIGENKIYFAIPKSLENEQELTESFKFKKDHYGWYLKEGQENFKKTYSNALKAFTIIK